MAFKKQTKKISSYLRDLRREGGLYSRIHLSVILCLLSLFFENLPALLPSLCRLLASSGFGAEREQLNEGAEEGVQPALVGHALLHHFLLTWVLSCLLNGVGLGKEAQI